MTDLTPRKPKTKRFLRRLWFVLDAFGFALTFIVVTVILRVRTPAVLIFFALWVGIVALHGVVFYVREMREAQSPFREE